MKQVICYFSASGTTKLVSERLSNIISADLFEIKPVNTYTMADLNWNDKNSRSSLEMEDNASRPAIANKIDIRKYDTIYLGYPIWWGLAPRIINTFIENVNLEHKKVYLFATSGGSLIENSFSTLKREYPNINFISGKLLHQDFKEDEISSWNGR